MSFFGSLANDPFAGLSRGGEEDEEIDFDDTYDGLGDGLDEQGDDLNAETFGGGASLGPTNPGKSVGTDFDFFGSTARVSGAIEEEQMRYNLGSSSVKAAPKPQATKKPLRTGYEVYKNPGYVADLEVDPTLWGQAPAKPVAKPAAQPIVLPAAQVMPKITTARKMMTLDEIEEQMAAQPQQTSQSQFTGYPGFQNQQQYPPANQQYDARNYQQGMPPPEYLQALQMQQQQQQREREQQQAMALAHARGQAQSGQVNAPVGQGAQHGAGGHIITHPHQLMHMSDEDRAAALAEDAKRAKRNHKIWLLSKGNGLMTPQDKNFITRIQLQQLMAATGGTEEKDPDTSLSEDFYYQVITSIRGGPRQNPNQPLSHFAQTYLFQTGGRTGGHRRHGRAENHMQRMEQQVQRAVEAAKLKPKNKQLVLEGSLGKISFSNAKTPKPLLNIKRPESSDFSRRQTNALTGSDRKSILNNIEIVYSTLMRLEDEARKEPFLPSDVDPTDDFRAAHQQWADAMQDLSSQMWDELKVQEAINISSNVPHPFIALLSYSKGKKAIPRIFRYLSSEQRVTMLTMIVIHLDILDVIRRGALGPGEVTLPVDARESVDLFSMTVTPSLFGYVSEASLFTVIGLLGLILDRVNVMHVAHTRVGLSILTMLTSRATLIREAGDVTEGTWTQWLEYYDRLFDLLEPILAGLFPPSLNVDDVYVWQFLAAIGSGATPEQQQRLVIAVKDRVMDTLHQSKTLPPDMAGQKRANVNLFMRAIGLDVGLLE